MLKVITKDYEVEEKVQCVKKKDGKEEILYEFEMKLTQDEVFELVEMVKKVVATGEKSEEFDGVQEEAHDLIGEICFKEHKEPFLEAGGKLKYYEMVEMLFDFFLAARLESQTKRANMMISKLPKELQNYHK